MVGHVERQRLLRAYYNEPSARIGMVIKCAACVLILAGIVAIGITSDVESEGSPAGRPAATASESRAAVEAKKAPEEHRARFESPNLIQRAQAAR